MSIPVDISELADRLTEHGQAAFLVTVGSSGAPHVVSVGVALTEGRLRCAAGRTTAANATARPAVTLLWPGRGGSDYCLLVDGTAELEPDGQMAVEPVRAVLHRLHDAAGKGPSCVTVLDRREQ